MILKPIFRKAEGGQKDDKEDSVDDELNLNVFETYVILFKILCLKPMLIMVSVLLTAKVNTLHSKLIFRSLLLQRTQ